MQPEWERYLRGAGARLAHGEVSDFGDIAGEHRASLEAAALVDLSAYAFIRARGAEALSFLNGQLTNDLRELDNDRYMLAAYCNPKGRVITLFRIWREADDLLLQLPAALAEAVLKRLRLFILRAKVSLALDDSRCAFGLIGPGATKLGHAADIQPGQLRHQADVTALRLRGIVPRYEWVLPVARRAELWKQTATAMPAGMRIWRWHDIQAGVPEVLPQTTEAFVPQMLNLDSLGGISFTKGCYPGQEIVARMHYLGRLKERLYRLSLTDAPTPAPATELFAPGLGNQSAGMVVQAVSLTPGHTDLLAVVQIASAEGDALHLGKPAGPSLKLETLPDSPAHPTS